jgi:hypothetical protein
VERGEPPLPPSLLSLCSSHPSPQVFTFDISRPECSQLYFRVMDSDLDLDDFIAYSSVPIDCMAFGYRTLKLFDNHGKCEGPFQFAGLFVRLTVEEM